MSARNEAFVRRVLAREVPASVTVDTDTLAPYLGELLDDDAHADVGTITQVLANNLGDETLAARIATALSTASTATFEDAFLREAGSKRGGGNSGKGRAGAPASVESRGGTSKGGARRGKKPAKFVPLDCAVGAVPAREGLLSAADEGQVCRYYLEDRCTRGDCPYLHDLSSTPCKFYATPLGCSAGDACRFFHDPAMLPPANDAPDAGTAGTMKEAGSGGNEHMSGLSAWTDDELLAMLAAHAAELSSLDGVSPADLSASGAPALELDEVSFPAIQSTYQPSGTLKTSAASATSAPAVKELVKSEDLYAALFRFAPPRSMLSQQRGLEAPSAAAVAASHPKARVGTAHEIARALPRIATGASMSALYASARAEAEAVARARNSAFDRAARAHVAGKRTLAAELAQEGRRLDARMHALHAVAADRIFRERNAGIGLEHAGATLRTAAPLRLATGEALPVALVDLHGLHPDEAVHAVDAVLQAGSTLPLPLWAALFCGARQHSKRYGRGGGSIEEAVLQHLGAVPGTEFYVPAVPAASAAAAAAGGSATSGATADTEGVIVLRLAPA